MTIEVSIEEMHMLRYGIALAYNHAKESMRAMKNDPLEVYRNQEVAKKYKGLADKMTKTVRAEAKKIIDNKKAGGVS